MSVYFVRNGSLTGDGDFDGPVVRGVLRACYSLLASVMTPRMSLHLDKGRMGVDATGPTVATSSRLELASSTIDFGRDGGPHFSDEATRLAAKAFSSLRLSLSNCELIDARRPCTDS